MRYYATTVILSFLATLLMGILLLPWLHRLKLGQQVRDDGPKTHLSKSGTPTMGGILFLVPLAVLSLILSKGSREYALTAVLTTIGFWINRLYR